MNKPKNRLIMEILVLIVFTLLPNSHFHAQVNKKLISGNSSFWVSAYLPSWELNMGPYVAGVNHANFGQLPVQNIDWSAFTHVIMFACGPNTNGTLSYGNLGVLGRKKPFNLIARANGRPVILAVGGAGNENWGVATSPANRMAFLNAILAELDTSQYDGIDLDIEPFRNTGTINDTTRIGPFIRRLYDSLQVRRQYLDPTKNPLLTAAILPAWAGEWYSKHEDLFDQINIMTYDMAQSMGWGTDRTWHNNAIYGPQPPTGTNLYYTSIQTRWIDQMYKRGGKNRSKYGIGVDFNGTLYRAGTVLNDVTKGVHEPKQRWATAPTFTWDYDFDVMFATYLDTATTATKRYDTEAQAAYLSILSNDGNPANEVKLSYTDSTQIHRIIQYARDSSMGGVILWNIGEAYLPSKYPNRDRMLQFVKKAVNSSVQNVKPKIKGSIFYDKNKDGIQNLNEPMMTSWVVKLTGYATLSAITDSEGRYSFDSIPIGSYTVNLEPKPLWQFTLPNTSGTYSVSITTTTDSIVCNFGLFANDVTEVILSGGWNLVSMPVKLQDTNAKNVFPTAISSLFGFTGSYSVVNTLEYGKGYFAKFDSPQTLLFAGDTFLIDTVEVNAGWNLIGSVSKEVPVSNISISPPGNITSDFWYLNQGYQKADTIKPGYGYWIKFSEPGLIILNAHTF
ncbi:MAG: glycosyl hydrolase family 18 protein [Bacteroidota bacterium]|nr:glycosyl hydrolase family 18 protein [Bacteroidota bacterium]